VIGYDEWRRSHRLKIIVNHLISVIRVLTITVEKTLTKIGRSPEQATRPVRVSPHETGLLSLDLRGKVKERYEAVRCKVEAEIATGTRTALQFATAFYD
jgi:hypothetical protein